MTDYCTWTSWSNWGQGHVCYLYILLLFGQGMLLIWLSTIFLWTDRRSSVSNHPLSASPCSVICIQCRQRQRQILDARDTKDKEFAKQRHQRKRNQDRGKKIKDKQIRKKHQLQVKEAVKFCHNTFRKLFF